MNKLSGVDAVYPYESRVDLIRLSIFVYLTTFVVEAPLRWLLAELGLGPLIYLRDGIPLALLARYLFLFLAGKYVAVGIVFMSLFGATCFFASIWFGLGLFQVMFGVKVLLPLAVGFCYSESVASILLFGIRYFRFLLLVTFFGLALDYFLPLPWEGMVMDVGVTSVSVGRVWYAGDFQRLSGFARTSFDAAMFAVVCYVVSASERKMLQSSFFWLVAAISIVLTTTKGIILAFMVATLIFAGDMISRSLSIFVGKTLSIFAILGGVVLPAISLVVQPKMVFSSFLERAFLYSFYDRMINTWPQALFRLDEPWLILFGRGFGGIGAAQAYFDPWNFNPADNVYVYVVSMFGLVGLFSFLFAFLRFISSVSAETPLVVRVLLVVVLFYGITTNLIDNAWFGLLIGLLLARGLELRRVA